MGVGKTERASLHDSRFTIGRRSDAANDRIIRNLKVKGGKIRKIGDKWTITPVVPTYKEIDEGITIGGGSCPNITIVPEDPTTAADTVDVITGIEPDGHELTLIRETITISPGGGGYPSAWDIEFLYSEGVKTGDVKVKNPAVVLGGRAVVIATNQEFTVTPASPNLYLWGTFNTVNLSSDGFVINNSDFDCELNNGSTPGSMQSPSNTKAYMLLYVFQVIEGVLSVKCDYRNTPTIGIF